jgi:hypothetical protein
MQNVALLTRVHGHRLIPGIDLSHYRAAMADLMSGSRLQMNLAVFAQGSRPIAGS